MQNKELKNAQDINTYEEFYKLMGVAEELYLGDNKLDKDSAYLLLNAIPCTDEWMDKYAEENTSSPFVKVH